MQSVRRALLQGSVGTAVAAATVAALPLRSALGQVWPDPSSPRGAQPPRSSQAAQPPQSPPAPQAPQAPESAQSAQAEVALRPPIVKRFESTAELAAYTRLSALRQPLLMAHRAGYEPWGGTPECSIFGAEQVIRRGPALIEIDLRTTADMEIVCLHDEMLDGGTTGVGKVSEVSAAYLSGLTLRDSRGYDTGLPLPTFSEFLAWAGQGAILWLDNKAVDPARLVAIIREQNAEARVIVSAYGKTTLAAYQSLAPDLVYFVPTIPELGLPDLAAILSTGLDRGHLIGFAGYDLPNLRGTLALADIDAPALIDFQRIDSRYSPKDINPDLYRTAAQQGLPLMNTEQYDGVMSVLELTDWA